MRIEFTGNSDYRFDDDTLRRAYEMVFLGTKEGRYVLEHLASISGMYTDNFVFDALGMSYQEGRRSVFLTICQKLDKIEIENIEGKNL